MSKTITGATTFGNTATVPENNVDLVSASVVEAVFQRLLNNTRYLQQLAEVTGVKLVRNVANLAALKALTGMADREVCWVEGLGLFFYDSGAAVVGNDVTIVFPTSGPGAWIHATNATRGVANGVASLDASGVLPFAQRPAYLKDQHFESNPNVYLTGTSGAKTVLSSTTDKDIQSGDIIRLLLWLNTPDSADYTVAGYKMTLTFYVDGSSIAAKDYPLAQLSFGAGFKQTQIAAVFSMTAGTDYPAGTTIEVRATTDSGAVADVVYLGRALSTLRVWRSA